MAQISLLRHQKPMLLTVGKILLKSLSLSKPKLSEKTLKLEVLDTKLEKEIVDGYHNWLNENKKYHGLIAPHLFPLWTYPDLFRMGQKLKLPLHKVLNQGVKLTINKPLRIEETLNSEIDIYHLKNLPQKFRINQKIKMGPDLENPSLIAEIHAVILKNPTSFLKNKSSNDVIDTSAFTLLDSLFISSNDAKNYAILSGDINPIHLSNAIAKLMGLKSRIMHGFGLYAKIFEKIESHQLQIYELDLKFLKPVYLDSNLKIYMKNIDEKKIQIRILSEDKKSIHLSGELILA